MRRLWATVFLLIILCGLFGPSIYNQRGIPSVPQPFDVAAEWDKAHWDDEESPPEKGTAAYYYDRAAKLYVPLGKEYLDTVDRSEAWADTDDEVKAWCKANELALETWRIGTTMPLKLQTRDFIALSFSVIDERDMFSLARLESCRLQTDRQHLQSWRWQEAQLRAAAQFSVAGNSISRICGHSFHSTACKNVVEWSVDPRVPSDLLTDAASFWNRHRVQSDGPSRIEGDFRGHRVNIAMLNELRNTDGQGLIDFRSEVGHPAKRMLLGEDQLAQKLSNIQAFRRLAAFRSPTEWKLANTEFLYFEPVKANSSNRPTAKQFADACKRLTFARFILEKQQYEERFHNSLKRLHARHNMITVVLAAERYRRRHDGQYPESMDALVAAELLATIPNDPQAMHPARVKYRPTDDGRQAIVWCVGWDGNDDGGSLEHVPSKGPLDYGYQLGPKPPID